ncbi:hypothetical protein GCM10009616_14880 [Microlunatus lacustris]
MSQPPARPAGVGPAGAVFGGGGGGGGGRTMTTIVRSTSRQMRCTSRHQRRSELLLSRRGVAGTRGRRAWRRCGPGHYVDLSIWLYGLGAVELSAPGGWLRDGIGTATFPMSGNMILSTYPLRVAIAEGLADANGNTTDAFSVRSCAPGGVCGFYTYLQGTSMAAPHVTGVAALVVDRHGQRTRHGSKVLDPDRVRRILERTAVDHACPVGGTEIYTDEGRAEAYNAVCEGTTRENGRYGEGIVNAAQAVRN